MTNYNQLQSDVQRLLEQHTEKLSFSALLELLMVIREWKAALTLSQYTVAVRHKQHIARLISAIIQQGGSLPDDIAELFYRLFELERQNIQEFEDYIAALNEHKISSLISKLYLKTNRGKNEL